MNLEQQSAGLGDVRPGHGFDEAALTRWMQSHVEEFRGPLAVSQFKGGQSNPTYRLATPGRAYVLRRKPSGPVAPGAHAVDREARVMAALGREGFPVPRVYGLCTDEAVIGGWFYVMEFMDGRVFWNARFETVAPETRPAYFDAMNQTLARLHGFDPVQLGLRDFGKRGDYFERQLSRWSRQYRADEIAGRDEAMDRLIDWLPGRLPKSEESRLIHGDFRADNMVFHPSEPRVIAVLDWELSTLGHPLADFANHLMMYRLPPEVLSGLKGVDLKAESLPTEDEYVANYCARTERTSIDDLEVLIAFSLFRLAAIYHGIRARALRGNASSAHAESFSEQYRLLSALGCSCAEAA
jgi:aminoglycoside phosphotransferase (APT) family kinase protein